jgi:anti-anti-sigma factor
MWDMVRFWLDLGVDGFRLDAFGTIYENPALTPHTVPMNLAELRRFSETASTQQERKLRDTYWHDMFCNQWGRPELHNLMKELRALMKEYDGDRMLVGEDENIAYMGDGDDELQLVFNFSLVRWVNSCGIGTLIAAKQLMDELSGHIVLCNLDRRPLNVLHKTRLYDFFDVTNSIEEALALLEHTEKVPTDG